MNSGSDISFYKDFEQWALDYAIITTKKLETYDRANHSQENREKISILQYHLEELNYKNRRKA